MSLTREQIKLEIDQIPLADLAWATGLFEGEGTFVLDRTKTGRPHLNMRVAMKDEDVIKRFHTVVTVGSCYQKTSGLWEWQVSRWRAEHLGWRLCMNLGLRRRARFLEILQEVVSYDQ